MHDTQAMIFYLMVFRVAVIAAGVVAIVLGYKLFLRGGGQAGGASGERIDVEAGAAKVRLHNVAPGTCFALFGAGLIVLMLTAAPPQVRVDERGMLLRGGDASAAASLHALARGPLPGVGAFWASHADALNDMAWRLYEAGESLDLAASLVDVALVAAPGDASHANYRDTRERIAARRQSAQR